MAYPHRKHISRAALLTVAVVVLILGLAVFTLVSPQFRVQAIDIEGLQTLSEDEIRTHSKKFLQERAIRLLGITLLPRDNILLIPTKALAQSLLSTFPKIARARIKRALPNRLTLTISERTASAIWCSLQECFWMSRDGVIFEPAPRVSGTVVLSILDERESQDIKLGSAPLSPRTVDFIAFIDSKFFETIGLHAKEWDISRPDASVVTLRTEEGWDIRFSTERTAERELSVLKKLLDEIIRERRQELSYIDLRDTTRLYYRYRSGGEAATQSGVRD